MDFYGCQGPTMRQTEINLSPETVKRMVEVAESMSQAFIELGKAIEKAVRSVRLFNETYPNPDSLEFIFYDPSIVEVAYEVREESSESEDQKVNQ